MCLKSISYINILKKSKKSGEEYTPVYEEINKEIKEEEKDCADENTEKSEGSEDKGD